MQRPGVEHYAATVADVADPDQLGRIRVICPELYGDAETALPAWISPRVAAGPRAGWWWIPPVGSAVTLEADGGALRWLGGAWGQANEPPPVLRDNYARRSGFTSPAGSEVLALDDDSGLLVEAQAGRIEVQRLEVVNGPGSEPTRPVLEALLSDLANALVELQAAAMALGLPTTQTAALLAQIQASVSGPGAPYLSHLTRTE